MKDCLRFVFLCFTFHFSLLVAFSQPSVEKIEPPNWWVGHTVNPVRVLLSGRNLQSATVSSQSNFLKIANAKSSSNGHYLFFDLNIAYTARQGKYKLKISTPNGAADFVFEISPPLGRQNRFQGYTTDDVIYFLMPDRFADGDQANNDPPKSKGLYDRAKPRHYHGGDLQGLINKLPYIKSLGATAIWTTPVYDNNDKLDYKEVYDGQPSTGYHGYGAIDFYAVDEHLGDIAKLRELIDKAHALGLKVIQDQVVNHTGPYHLWANDPPTPTWWNGSVEKHTSNNWQKWTAMNPRATYQTQSRNIDGWFIDILPDFNQNDPEVEKYLTQNSLWWLGMAGFDAIRMDTLPHVPRAFWEKWSTAVKKEYPKVNVLGEVFDGDPALLSYFQGGRRGHDGVDTKIDTLFDFGLFYRTRGAFARGESIRGVSNMFAHDWLYPNPNVLTTFIGVHDMERFMNEKGATIEGLKLAQTLIMTSRGTPLLYYGDEIAVPGGGDPDNRRDFPGGFPGDKGNAWQPEGRTTEQSEVWNHLALLGKLRREIEPLRRGKTLDLFEEEQQIAFARFTERDAAIIAINNDTKPATFEFSIADVKAIRDGAKLVDQLGGAREVRVENQKLNFELPARSAGIFVQK